jgi:hypothetical protein
MRTLEDFGPSQLLVKVTASATGLRGVLLRDNQDDLPTLPSHVQQSPAEAVVAQSVERSIYLFIKKKKKKKKKCR